MKRRSSSCCCRWLTIFLLASSFVLVSPETSATYVDNHKQPKIQPTSTAVTTVETTSAVLARGGTDIIQTNARLQAMGLVGAKSYNGGTSMSAPRTMVSTPQSSITIIVGASPTIPTHPSIASTTEATKTIKPTAPIKAMATKAVAGANTGTVPRSLNYELSADTANLNGSNVKSRSAVQQQHEQLLSQLNITTSIMPPATWHAHTDAIGGAALGPTLPPGLSLKVVASEVVPSTSATEAPGASNDGGTTNQPTHFSRQLPAFRDAIIGAEVQGWWRTTKAVVVHPFHAIDQVKRGAQQPPQGLHKRNARQADEEPIDKCRLFVEGDPEKNEFYSPDYPNNYPKNINCTRVITAPKGSVIRLDFRNSFHIEAKEECKFDFLEIRDGQYGFSNQIGKFCGTDFPPEITSKERYLWLHFHSDESIEYSGFTAVFEFIDRNREAPSTDLNCTIEKEGYEGFINSTDVPYEVKEVVSRNKIPLDCIWRIQVQDGWKIQVKFIDFKLSKPNDCETNFLDIFPEQTVMPLRVKNFCGSAGEGITSETHILHMRFYAEQVAINSSFSILYTAFRDRGAACTEDEYDCEDATCISKELECNGRDNCKFRWDEEGCAKESAGQSEHVVIIIIVFGLILGGMMITFLVNCIRKIMHDQKIIREHIRQSKESKLDEMGRNSKARSRENIHSTIPRGKHSQVSLPMLEEPSTHYYREVIPMLRIPSKVDLKEREHSILRQRNDMIVQTSFCSAGDDNSSDVTLEAHSKHHAAAPQACDMGCQTRESLFATPLLHQSSLASNKDKVSLHSRSRFSTFGYETPTQAIATPAAESIHDNMLRSRGYMDMQARPPPNAARTALPHLQRIDALPPTPPTPATAPAEICHHHHHIQHQRHHQHPHQAQVTSMRPEPSTAAPPAPSTTTTGPSSSKSKTPKLSQSTAYIDIRNSAPDVIIMTSQ